MYSLQPFSFYDFMEPCGEGQARNLKKVLLEHSGMPNRSKRYKTLVLSQAARVPPWLNFAQSPSVSQNHVMCPFPS